MAVNIDIDLSAADARAKVESLRAEIKSLEDSLDVDLKFSEDLDDIGESLDNFTTKIEDLRVELDGLESDLSETLAQLDDTQIGVRMPEGTTGATGGENDPPTQNFTIRTEGLKEAVRGGDAEADGGITDFNARQTARQLESRFDLNRGAISADTLRDMNIQEVNAEIAEFVDRTGRNPYPNKGLLFANRDSHDFFLDDEGRFFDDVDRDLIDQMSSGDFRFDMEAARVGRMTPDMDMRVAAGMTPETVRNVQRIKENYDGLGSVLRQANRSVNRFGGALRRIKPSMRQWWQLLALLLPLLIAVGVQAAGAAAALLGLAAAATAVVGVGLLGHAEDMGDAFEEARNELGDLKDDLFETFQGPMQLFAPIQSEVFDWLPGQLLDVADSMEGLTAYEDTIFEFFGSLSNGIAEFFDILVRNEGIVSQLGMRFGSLLGGGLLEGFEWLIQTAYENQEVLVDLGAVIMDILGILYNLSMLVGRIASAMRPFFAALKGVSDLLNNELLVGLLTFLTVAGLIGVGVTSLAVKVYTLVTAVQALVAWLAMLGGGSVMAGISAFFATLWSYIQATVIALMEMYSAAQLAAMALAATGVGALVVGAGLTAGAAAMGSMGGPDSGGGGNYGNGPPGAGGRGGQTVVYNDNRQYQIQNEGQMDNASEQRIRSTIDNVNAEGSAMAPPDAGLGDGGDS